MGQTKFRICRDHRKYMGHYRWILWTPVGNYVLLWSFEFAVEELNYRVKRYAEFNK